MLLHLFPALFPTHWQAHQNIVLKKFLFDFAEMLCFIHSQYKPSTTLQHLSSIPASRQLVVSSRSKTTQLAPKVNTAFCLSDLMSIARKDNSHQCLSPEASARVPMKIIAILNQLQGSRGKLWVLYKHCDKANLEKV